MGRANSAARRVTEVMTTAASGMASVTRVASGTLQLYNADGNVFEIPLSTALVFFRKT